MPRAPLATRFGNDLLRRLDQAFGDVQESFCPLAPPQPMIVSRNFAEPVAAASDIVAMISYLADEMARLLYHTGMAARRLELGWQLVDGGRHCHHIHLSRPSRQAALFHRLLAGLSDRINPEFGIETGWMQAHDCSPLAPVDQPLHHMATSADSTAGENYASLIDRLVARLGYGSVVHLKAAGQLATGSRATDHVSGTDHAGGIGGGGWLAGANTICLGCKHFLQRRRHALFVCWHIRTRLMWWRCCRIIRQPSLSGNAARIKLSKPAARNALPRLGGRHLPAVKAGIISVFRIITGPVSGCIVTACRNAAKQRPGFCMGFLPDGGGTALCGTWLL